MENTENNPLIIEQEQFLALPLFDLDNLVEAESLGNTLPNIDNLGIELSSGEDYQDNSLFPPTISYFIPNKELKVFKTEDELTGASIGDTAIENDDWKQEANSNTAKPEPNTVKNNAQGIFYLGLKQAIASLQKLQTSDSLAVTIDQAFGKANNLNQARQEISSIINGEAKIEFELVAEASLGARGGYSQSNNQIFLAEEFLERSDIDKVTGVILEEIGHYLDQRINQADTPGDEGAIFAALTLDQKIEPEELKKLQNEDDSTTVLLKGKEQSIERSSLSSPRSATVNDEIFLGGTYLELGINSSGSFGSTTFKPNNFYGTNARNRIGIIADLDGFNLGEDLRTDYFMPGSPEERWSIGYTIDGSTVTASNAKLRGSTAN